MNIKYLNDRLEQAKAQNADVVKIDIEEFASLLKWVDEEKAIVKFVIDKLEMVKKELMRES